MLANAGIATICIFGSTPANIQKYASGDLNPAPQTVALSDKTGQVYKRFHFKVKRGGAIGGFLSLGLEIGKGIPKYYRYIRPVGAAVDVLNKDGGKMGRLPADFLIDEEGKIVDLMRSEHVSDQMPFERIEAFIPEDRRCRCSRQDCISPRCRENYEDIRSSDLAMLHM